jgi:hypothetical protein
MQSLLQVTGSDDLGRKVRALRPGDMVTLRVEPGPGADKSDGSAGLQRRKVELLVHCKELNLSDVKVV